MQNRPVRVLATPEVVEKYDAARTLDKSLKPCPRDALYGADLPGEPFACLFRTLSDPSGWEVLHFELLHECNECEAEFVVTAVSPEKVNSLPSPSGQDHTAGEVVLVEETIDCPSSGLPNAVGDPAPDVLDSPPSGQAHTASDLVPPEDFPPSFCGNDQGAIVLFDGPSPIGEANVPADDCPPSGFGNDQGAVVTFDGPSPSGEANVPADDCPPSGFGNDQG